MNEIERLRFWVYLLEMEIEALRSVLTEYGSDYSTFTQWQKAMAIDELKKSIKNDMA